MTGSIHHAWIEAAINSRFVGALPAGIRALARSGDREAIYSVADLLEIGADAFTLQVIAKAAIQFGYASDEFEVAAQIAPGVMRHPDRVVDLLQRVDMAIERADDLDPARQFLRGWEDWRRAFAVTHGWMSVADAYDGEAPTLVLTELAA